MTDHGIPKGEECYGTIGCRDKFLTIHGNAKDAITPKPSVIPDKQPIPFAGFYSCYRAFFFYGSLVRFILASHT